MANFCVQSASIDWTKISVTCWFTTRYAESAEKEEPEPKFVTSSISRYYAVTEFFCNKSAKDFLGTPWEPLCVRIGPLMSMSDKIQRSLLFGFKGSKKWTNLQIFEKQSFKKLFVAYSVQGARSYIYETAHPAPSMLTISFSVVW